MRGGRAVAGGCCLCVLLLTTGGQASGQVNTWQSIGPEGGSVAGIVQDPKNTNVLYAVIDEVPVRVYASTDHGSSWSVRGTADATFQGANVLMIDKNTTSTLYLGGNGVIFKSTDSGQHWATIPNSSGISFWQLMMDPSSPLTFHAIGGKYENSKTYPAYHRSTNAGVSWTTTKIVALEGSPTMLGAAGNMVFATVYLSQSGGYALYRSTNGGVDFVEKTGTISAYMTKALVDPAAPSRAWVGTGAGVYRTTDSGETWTLNDGYVYSISSLYLKTGSPGTLYAGGYFDGVFASTDGGVQWTLRLSGLYGNSGNGMVVEASPSNYVFSARNAGIFRSSDGGQNWQASYNGIVASRVVTVRMAPSQQSYVYAAVDDDAVYKTTRVDNAIVGWDRLGSFLHCGYVNDIAVSPTDPTRAYAVGGT
jgi:hypothetical protein